MLPVTRGFPYEASRIFITPVASRSLYGMALTEPLYKSLYNTIQYNTVLQIALQWLNQSIYQSLYLQETPRNSPVRVSYGVVSCEDFG